MPTIEVTARAVKKGRVPIMCNVPAPLYARLQRICDETCLPFTDIAVRALEQYLHAEIVREQTAAAAALKAQQQAEFEAFIEYQRGLRSTHGTNTASNANQLVAAAV